MHNLLVSVFYVYVYVTVVDIVVVVVVVNTTVLNKTLRCTACLLCEIFISRAEGTESRFRLRFLFLFLFFLYRDVCACVAQDQFEPGD